jgi:hypothetical protein
MQLTLDIPEQFVQGQNQSQISQQIKLYAGLLMFQSGQISCGAVLVACKKHGISSINTSADAIEDDILRFKQRHYS